MLTPLLAARLRAGLKQQELAAEAQVSRQYLGLAERGMIPGPTVRAGLSRVLAVPEGELFPGRAQRCGCPVQAADGRLGTR